MMISSPDQAVTSDSNPPLKNLGPWWREWEVGLLLIVAALLFLPRLTQLNVRGEEPRRAQVAVEMIGSGDWIVPHQQGELYFSRPPMQNWAIGLFGLARGQVDRWAIRLPSVLAVFAVVLLIYAYGRTFLSRTASLAAGIAFASMAQVLELGRLGETDMMFTLFVTGSLLVWHYGRTRGWPAARTWCFAYLMVALGTLTKGPQAPVYFASTVGVYLLITRRWRDAISWSHAAGIGLFLVVWGAWQVPYFLAVGLDGTMRIYGRNVAVRFNDTGWVDYVNHFFNYPLEILFGCLLPWSVLLLAYANRDFRRRIGPAREHVVFLLVALVVTFPSVWFVPTARSRYFMPLYPCFALLIGLVVDRCAQADPTAAWRRLWPRFLGGVGLVMGVLAVAVLAVSFLGRGPDVLIQPIGFAVAYAIVAGLLAIVALWASRDMAPSRRVLGMVAIAAFMGVTLIGVFNNSLARRSVDQPGMVAKLKQQLPEDAQLVSLGQIHHLFAYHYGKPIKQLPVPEKGDSLPTEYAYFCFHSEVVTAEALPPNFETLAIIPCDRFKKETPVDYVTVCRRIDPGQKPKTTIAIKPEASKTQ